MASTEGVMKAAKEAPGAGEAVMPAAAVLVVLGVDEEEGVSVPVALAAGAPAVGVVEGVGVTLALALGPVVELAVTPGRDRVASQDPPHRMYCAGQGVAPLCWQHVSMGSATLRGLKCMRYVWRESYMPKFGVKCVWGFEGENGMIWGEKKKSQG